MTSMRVCAHQLLRQSSGLRVAAPLRPAMRGKVARRSFATESGGEGGQHWSKDKAQVSNIKKYGTMSMVGAFAAGLSWRTYQWYALALPCPHKLHSCQPGARSHAIHPLPPRRATGTLPDTTLSGAPKSTAAAVPTEEALAAATKKSVVHWEGEARAPVGLASEATPAAAAAAAAAEDELDYPEGSAKAMKLAYDLEQIVQRLAKVGDAVGCPEPKVVTHVALLKLKPEATTADKDEIVAGLRRLPSQIPEISAFRAGEDLGLDPSGRSIALVGEFASVDDYKVRKSSFSRENQSKIITSIYDYRDCKQFPTTM